jgi:hypothetical protein
MVVVRALPAPGAVRVRGCSHSVGTGHVKRHIAPARALHGMRGKGRDTATPGLGRQQHRLPVVSYERSAHRLGEPSPDKHCRRDARGGLTPSARRLERLVSSQLRIRATLAGPSYEPGTGQLWDQNEKAMRGGRSSIAGADLRRSNAGSGGRRIWGCGRPLGWLGRRGDCRCSGFGSALLLSAAAAA